ncbi:MAG TPA: FG-GAP-like repeat-containing protein [Burkholderiales bacterium]|nr:FG-GAP-like repeat-containing protein [Burkholderiales bacterium]
MPVIRQWAGFPARGDPRFAIAAILAAYVTLGIAVLGFNRSPLQVAIAVAAAVLLDMTLHRVFRGGPPLFPLSAVITGLSLGILVNYAHGWWFALVPIFLAIGSKYLFTFGGRHLYNPALFGVVASLLLADGMISESPAYQWGGTYAAVAFVVTLGLLLFVLPVRRGTLIVSFLAFYFIALAARAWLTRWHMPVETWFMGALTSPAFFLFTFFMITDPQTSPHSKRGQVLMAFGIVAVDFLLHLKFTLSTNFFAAFACASLRLAWLHGYALLEGPSALLARLRYAVPRWSLVAALAGGGLIAHGGILAIDDASELDFRLVEVDARDAGITARSSDVLNRVDPRIAHIGKWLLSVGDAVAAADVDNDGLQDLFLTNSLKDARDRAALYRNLGGFRFERIPLPVLNDLARHPERDGLVSGALFIDYDGDGDQDLLVLVGWGNLRFLKNLLVETGRLTFVDVTRATGLDEYAISVSANALDVDRDGKLDLIIGHVMNPTLPGYATPRAFNVFHLPQPEYSEDRRMFNFMHRTWHSADNGGGVSVYFGRGNGFARADERALGFSEKRWTLAIGAGDLNNDGWPDLYLANDFGPDQLMINRDGKRFEAVKGALVGDISRDTYKGMNASFGDFDGNGYLDIYVSNVHEKLQAEGSLLWMNSGGAGAAAWSDHATRRNALNEKRFGWGAAIGDLDRDGRLDILQANGMVDNSYDPIHPGCPDYWYWNDKIALTHPDVHGHADRWADLRGRCIFPYERNRVYLNRGRYFVDVAQQVGWGKPGNSRGIALVDLDNDGDLDVVVTHQFQVISIYRNDSAPKAWLGLALEGNGSTCNRDAVGTRVFVAVEGVKRQLREIQAANGFSAQSDRRLLFGLGHAEGPVEVTIHWCGEREASTFSLSPGRYHKMRQP